MVAHPPITSKDRNRKMIILRLIMSSLLLVRRSRRNNFQPATRTLFYVWIVTLGILAEIPIILFLWLDIYRRLLLDDRGSFRIVWIIVRIGRRTPPPRPPFTPSRPDPDTPVPGTAAVMFTSTMTFTAAIMATPTMPGTPINCIPRHGACKEKHQNNKDRTNRLFHFHLLLCGGFLVPSSTIKKIIIPFLLLL
jgi:hypothetical protein